MVTTAFRQRESDLLRDIGALADRLRDLRRTDAVRHDAQIKALTGDLQLKWGEIRALRAAPTEGDASLRNYRGSYT